VEILSISVTLFLIMDPFGNMPVFLSILDRVPPERRRKVLVRELLFALGIIIVFILFGKYVMTFLGLRQESVSIAGGIILFLIALRMVFPRHEPQALQDLDGEPLLVPLAIPLIAGPSMLAVLLLFATADPEKLVQLLLAASLAWTITFLVLFTSTFLVKYLKKRGLIAIKRLMGMVLITLSVQLFLDGITNYTK
jgi:multiple antibiotic resistance protein